MAWKARLFMGLMLTVMLLAITGPAMADDNNRQERREERREDRQEFRKDFFDFGDHDFDFDDCCHDVDFDEEVFLVDDFGFYAPLVYVVEIDVDCDGIDDRWDRWIGHGCVIEDIEIEPLFD